MGTRDLNFNFKCDFFLLPSLYLLYSHPAMPLAVFDPWQGSLVLKMCAQLAIVPVAVSITRVLAVR